jgi:hypothetical protein
MDEVRAHAQKYQDKSSREAQNSEMLIQCLKASITRTVYNKVYLQMSKYISIGREPWNLLRMEYAFSRTSLTTIILIPDLQLSKSGNS